MNWINKNKWALISCVVLGVLLWYVCKFNVNIAGMLKWANEYKPDIKNIKTPELPPVWKPKAPDIKGKDTSPVPPQSSIDTPKKEDIAYIPTLSESTWIHTFEAERSKN
jgi:hypothetical protein